MLKCAMLGAFTITEVWDSGARLPVHMYAQVHLYCLLFLLGNEEPWWLMFPPL